MPPLADIDKNHLEVQVFGTLAALGGDAQMTVTTLHYYRLVAGVAYSASAFITAFQAQFESSWLAAVSVHWTWDKTTVRVINSPTEAAVEAEVAEPGTVAGDAEPSYVAVIMAKRSPFRGRNFLGRSFIGGVAEASTTGNAIEAATAKPLFDTLSTKMEEDITENGNTWQPSILSRGLSQLDKDTDPAVVTMVPISDVICRSRLGRMSQRKSRVS